MTKRIGITNQKGGVSKTTNTINVAGALAERGVDVLAIDMDPQGYLTHRLGFEEAYKADSPNFADALTSPSDYQVRDLVVEHEEYDVLPANIDMFTLEQELIGSGMRPRLRLTDLLEGVDDWDMMIFDSPPSLGPLNDNVVLAAQNLLVPVEADESSQLALTHLLRQLDTLEDNYGAAIDILGIIVSNVSYPLDNEQQASIDWYEKQFDGRAPVWIIRSRAALKRAVKSGVSVFSDDAEDVDMADVYAEIAAEVAP
jgi:chromosome partitioning protein